MKRFSCDAASLGLSESRKRSRPNDFHGTDQEVRPCLNSSAESFIDKYERVSDVASTGWMQNGLERASHGLRNLPGMNVGNAAIDWPALPVPPILSSPIHPEFNTGATNEPIQQDHESEAIHRVPSYALENNLPNPQSDMRDSAMSSSAFQDPTFLSHYLYPECNIDVANQLIREETRPWPNNSNAGDLNTNTQSSHWNSEYEYRPFEGYYAAFNNPLNVEVTETDGRFGDNTHPFTFDDGNHPVFPFPSQPAISWQEIGFSIDEINPISPTPVYLKSDTSYKFTSNVFSASSPAVRAVDHDGSVLIPGSNSDPNIRSTPLSESLEYEAVPLAPETNKTTFECDLCFGVVVVFFSHFLNTLVNAR
jgi:hypothetical protein